MAESALWVEAHRRLIPWTVRRHKVNATDALDVVQDAIRLFINAGGIADPSNPSGLFRALGSKINGIMVDERRNKSRQAVELTADGDAAEPTCGEDPIETMENDDFARKAIGAVLERLSKDPLAEGIVMQMADGVLEPADQARNLGQAVGEIYKARRRLDTHVDAIRKKTETW